MRQELTALEFTANTPGTKKDREHSLQISLNYRLKTAAFKFHSPETHIDAKGESGKDQT